MLSEETWTQFVDMEMKKNLYYNNDLFYATWPVAVGQTQPSARPRGSTVPFAHEGPAHSTPPPPPAQRGFTEEADSAELSLGDEPVPRFLYDLRRIVGSCVSFPVSLEL